ncbi:hypothetical protein F5148DRAFT_1146024 [Russula earlei]|uniref:Uncharacterized protein n=1 Tax=Russula earlei TaxID=71964 RepID=A0ACC0UN88_9AGAM|nr:hypothetical protein F5148DRAFT_1146024 [Russula earlei]
MSTFVHSSPTTFPPAPPVDPNSPVLFKDNIDLAQTQINTVRSLAHEALNAIRSPPSAMANGHPGLCSKGAYQPGSTPAHAADILATLRQQLRTLDELLYTTGVGSLPLLPPEATEPFTEEQLADQANKAISTLFTLHTRMQETAAVAASIMAAPEQAPRR